MSLFDVACVVDTRYLAADSARLSNSVLCEWRQLLIVECMTCLDVTQLLKNLLLYCGGFDSEVTW
jgi:hypothetical protein